MLEFFIYLALLKISLIYADIITYQNHVLYPERPEYLVIPKYDKSEVPSWSPGKGRSFIDLAHVIVKSTCAETKGKKCRDNALEMLMFEAPKSGSWKEYWPDDEYCCTPELIDQNKYVLYKSCSIKHSPLLCPKFLDALRIIYMDLLYLRISQVV